MGVDASQFDFQANPLPLYNGDLEKEGMPENVKLLKERVRAADIVIYSSPEYNATFTPMTKNTIDWVSRAMEEGSSNEWSGKIVGLMSAAPGPIGGLRSLIGLRVLMSGVGAFVVPSQVAVGLGGEVIGEDELDNERAAAMFTKMLEEVVSTAQCMRSKPV